MLGNKICVTEKGLDIIAEGHRQYKVQQTLNHSRNSSLPYLKSANLTNRQTIENKLAQNDKLAKLSMKLQTIQKIGLRKLVLRREDKVLSRILNEELNYKQKYLTTIIPTIVRKTRDPLHRADIDSRYIRSMSYTQRLLKNYKSQQKFGAGNNIKNKSRENEEELNGRSSKMSKV